MSLNVRWIQNDSERDRVGEVRALCYANARDETSTYIEQIRSEKHTGPGDHLLVERDGVGVGTATQIRQVMWVRGGSVACQGVAYVGTVKTQRRRGAGEDVGIGTVAMREVLRAAREREAVVSALMPFRGSYYEHFGYGIVERRAQWTVPMSI